MKKCEMPKPKFDVGDVVAFKKLVTTERADSVPNPPSEIKGAGTIDQLAVTKSKAGWGISYQVGEHSFAETELKKVNI